MRILIVHDQFGQIQSVAIPGQKLPFGEVRQRPGVNDFVTEVDASDLPYDDGELASSIQKIQAEFYVTTGSAQLVRKQESQ